jgi:hypothetical protein
VIAPPQTLTCTISAGSTVMFEYMRDTLRHQVLSVGKPEFATSPIYDPTTDVRYEAHGVVLTTPGTYKFLDAYSAGAGGQIIVQ